MEQDGAPPVLPRITVSGWRAKPLVSYQAAIGPISSTTKTGLKVHCELGDNLYPKGIAVSDAEMASLNIQRAEFHNEWNYTIAPSKRLHEAIVS